MDYFDKLTVLSRLFEKRLVEYDDLISFNEIYIKRLANLAVITKERASTMAL